MKPATLEAIKTTREVMLKKYPEYAKLEAGERVLLCMAYLADAVKPREDRGNNRGLWIDIFADAAGVPTGNPWCAASLTFACKVAGVDHPARPAAVANWSAWFTDETFRPKRGMVAMKNSGGGKGHIGIVVKVWSVLGVTWLESIEGNTSPGEGGSQRDGDGLYRRKRMKSFWSWGFGELR